MPRHYDQQQIDFDEQIALLKSEGLTFADEARARHLLQNISFFRIKAYLRPFRQTASRSFKAGATFEQAYELYKFDAELRRLITSQLQKIEISARTQLSYFLTDAAGNFWFAELENFRNTARHSATLQSIQHELSRSDEEEILGFRAHYDDPFPPSWMTMEVTSFGSLSMLYKWLRGGHARRRVAAFYGLSDSAFESWLHSMVYLRNICAHHGRLWNRTLRIQPVTPRAPRHPFLAVAASKDKLFYSLSILLYFLQTIHPDNHFVADFKDLLKKYPMVDLTAMGFSENWQSEPLWK